MGLNKGEKLLSTAGTISSFAGMFDSLANNIEKGITSNSKGYSENDLSINDAIWGGQGSHILNVWNGQGRLNNALYNIYEKQQGLNYNVNSTNDIVNLYGQINDNYKNTNFNKSDLTKKHIINFAFDPAGNLFNLRKNNPHRANRIINLTIDAERNNALNNASLGISNYNRQNNYNNMAFNTMALGGALDYSLQNLYALNNYVNALNKSKITSLPNSFLKPLFDSMNYFAMGGSPDFNEFNTGGTHELNSNGGIPVRLHTDGTIVTVEQDETMTATPNGAYVFSDRLKLSKKECELLRVPVGSTYAEASKILRKEYDEMPNDDIAKRGWEQSRDILIQSLEILKQEIALKEARKQGLNSTKMLGINPQMMLNIYYNENPQEETLLQQGINPNIYNAFGGLVRKHATGSFLNPDDPPSVQNNNTSNTDNSNLVDWLTEEEMPKHGMGNSFFKYYNSDKGFNGSSIYNNNAYDPNYLTWLQSTTDFGPYFTERAKNQMLKKYNDTKKTNLTWEDLNGELAGLGSDSIYGYYTKMMENAYNSYLNSLSTPEVTVDDETSEPENTSDTNTHTLPITDNFDPSIYKTKNKNYSDYIPLAASLLGILSASLDNSLPNRLYNELNNLPRVSVPKDTNYMTYNPIDINRYLNQYNAQAASIRNNIMNTSNPNRNASLLAAAYDNNIGYGNLVQTLEAQNQKDRRGVLQFNKGVNDSKIQALIEADRINQAYDQMNLSGFIQGLDMENRIQQDYAKAIQGGLQGIVDFYNNRAAERKGLMTAGLAAVSQGTPFTDAMINYGYNIDPYLGEALFSSRSDYNNYVNMQHRNDVVNALKKGTYNTNLLGNLSRYTADPYIADFIRNQYKLNKNFDFKKYGLTKEELDEIIGVS